MSCHLSTECIVNAEVACVEEVIQTPAKEPGLLMTQLDAFLEAVNHVLNVIVVIRDAMMRLNQSRAS